MGYIEETIYKVVEYDQLGSQTVGEYSTFEMARSALMFYQRKYPNSKFELQETKRWSM